MKFEDRRMKFEACYQKLIQKRFASSKEKRQEEGEAEGAGSGAGAGPKM
jgi:hypothetical protein